MPISSADDRDHADKQRGFVVGKRVWLKVNTWDGALLAKTLGEANHDLVLATTIPDAFGCLSVTLGDGTRHPIRKDLLRLTPPPALSGRQEKAKATKPKARKEAVSPEFGTETTIFDFLES